jgi:hypothetical protein
MKNVMDLTDFETYPSEQEDSEPLPEEISMASGMEGREASSTDESLNHQTISEPMPIFTVEALQKYAAQQTLEIEKRVRSFEDAIETAQSAKDANATGVEIIKAINVDYLGRKHMHESAAVAFLWHMGHAALLLKETVSHGQFYKQLEEQIPTYSKRRIQEAMFLARCVGALELAGLGPERNLKIARKMKEISKTKNQQISILSFLEEKKITWNSETPITDLKTQVDNLLKELKSDNSQTAESDSKNDDPNPALKLIGKIKAFQESAKSMLEAMREQWASFTNDQVDAMCETVNELNRVIGTVR